MEAQMITRMFTIIFILCALAGTSMAEEIKGPIFPAYFDGFAYNISGNNAPSLLEAGETIRIDTSDGYKIDPEHFYYVGINNGKTIPYLGSEYYIESIGNEAILKQKVWEKDGITIVQGKPKALSRGYSVFVSDHSKEKDQISLVLRKDGEIIDQQVMDIGSQVNFTTEYAGNEIVLFSGSFTGFFDNGKENSFRISNANLWDMNIVKDGYSPDDVFTIKLKDVDDDGDMDITGEIKEGKSLDLNNNTVIPLFGNSFFIKTGTFYDSFYEELENYDLLAQNKQYKIFGTNEYEDIGDANSFLQNPPASTIAVGPRVTINTTSDFQEDMPEFIMHYLLRGTHTFYTYIPAQGITLSVGKKDMNNYAGADELKVNIYSTEGDAIASMKLADDEDITNSKVAGIEQTSSLQIDDVEPGNYRIDMSAGTDLYISTLNVSSGKLVAKDSVFLISPGEILATSKHSMDVCFKTYHSAGLQTISVIGSDFNRTVNVNATATCFSLNLPYSDAPYSIHVPKGDMIISTSGYLAFTEDSLFNPTSCELLNLQRSREWIQENDVDYIVVPASREQKGFYIYKEVVSEYEEESSLTPWTLDRVDTFMSPGLFYFDFDKYHTYEYIRLDTTGPRIDGNNFSYTSLQVTTLNEQGDVIDRSVALLGEPYSVLYIDDEKAILAKKTANGATATLSDSDSYKLGAGYSLVLNGIDIKGGQVFLSLLKDGIKVHDFIGETGTHVYYNTSIDGKEVTILSSKVDSAIRSAQKSTLKLTEITFKNEKDLLILEDGKNIANGYVLDLQDVNDDGKMDIEIRLQKEKTLYLKENRKTSILGNFAAFETDAKQRVKIMQNSTLQGSSLRVASSEFAEQQEELFLSWAYPSRNATIQFTKMGIESLELTFEDEIQSAYLVVQQLRVTSPHTIPDVYEIYRIYNISIVPDSITDCNIYLKISSTWIDDMEIDTSSIAVLRIEDADFEELDTQISTLSNGDVNIKAEISNSSAIVIVGKTINNTYTDTETLGQAEKDAKISIDNNLHTSGTTVFAIVTISLMTAAYIIYKHNDHLKRGKSMSRSSKGIENHRELVTFNHNVFSTLFATMLLLFLMENLWIYSVSAYIDVRYLVVPTIVSGLVDILFFREEKQNKQKFRMMDVVLALMIAIIGIFMVDHKLARATSIANEVSILSGMLLLIVAMIFYDFDLKDLFRLSRKEKEKKKGDE
jgi:PGF-pre-PGF domain-containing protein